MKAYGGVDIEIHVFLTSTLAGDESKSIAIVYKWSSTQRVGVCPVKYFTVPAKKYSENVV
jgi:hypothetical protein